MSLLVDDYDEAISFFVDVLGFDLVQDVPSLTNDGQPKRWVEVKPPNAETGLLIAKADGPEQVAAVGKQFAGRVSRRDFFGGSLNQPFDQGVTPLGGEDVAEVGDGGHHFPILKTSVQHRCVGLEHSDAGGMAFDADRP